MLKPDGSAVMRAMSDQEVFDWDCAHYGKAVAIQNLTDSPEPHVLRLRPGPEG